MPLSYDDNKPTTVHDEFALGSAQTRRGEEIAQYEPGGAEEKVGDQIFRHPDC